MLEQSESLIMFRLTRNIKIVKLFFSILPAHNKFPSLCTDFQRVKTIKSSIKTVLNMVIIDLSLRFSST